MHLLQPRSSRQLQRKAANLPNEILTAIFDGLSQHALTSVARVCGGWRAAAERLLYTSVVIHESFPSTQQSQMRPKITSQAVPATTIRCCETLAAHAHLTEAVRRFHLRWATDRDEGHSLALLLLVAQNVITVLLPTFVNVESLELSLGLGAHMPPLASLLGRCTFPHLRSLTLAGLRGAPEAFLHRNPGIVHLRLADFNSPLQLAPADLPRLTSFRGTPVTAASLLSARPTVHTLGLVGHEFVTERDLAQMSHGGSVRLLDLSQMRVTPVLLRDISRYMPDVQALRVRLALRHTLHYALYGIRLLAGLTPVLGAFRSLQTLDLSPTDTVDPSVQTSAEDSDQQEYPLCTAWAAACPTLRRVIFPSKREWIRVIDGHWTHL